MDQSERDEDDHTRRKQGEADVLHDQEPSHSLVLNSLRLPHTPETSGESRVSGPRTPRE